MKKLFSQNKKFLILIAGTALILVLAPLHFAEAINIAEWCGCVITIPGPLGLPDIVLPSPDPICWFRCLAGAIISLPIRIFFAIIVGILGIGALIAGFFYAIVSIIVTWLIGTIMSIGIVPGAANTPEIVEIGWNFSRQFANLFFILALAFIGLATILRIKEYEAKKALPTLIIIALLINFTPVIVGFVVDMGNIVTNFFLTHAGGINNFWGILETAYNYLADSIVHIFIRDGEFLVPEEFLKIMGEFLGIVIYGLVLFIFFHLAMFVYLMVGAVFFCRTVILWILMILSPIAFLSKVFPPGRTTKMVFPDILHWDKWWEKLIQWTVIGIPISFFLYLSNMIMTSTTIHSIFDTDDLEYELGIFEADASSTFLLVLHDQFTSLFTSLLAPVLGLMLLVMGMMISFKAAPEGAKGIMRFTHGGGQRAWSGIKRLPGNVKNIRDSYSATRAARPDLTKRQVFGKVIKQATWEKRPWKAWPWQKKQQPSAATAEEKVSTEAPWAIDQGAGPEEILRQKPSPPTPTTPPRGKHRARAAKVGKAAGKIFFVEPAKIGLWAGTGILKATRSAAAERINKEMKAKKEKGQKTCSNPICQESIDADVKFCPGCGQTQP